MTVITLAGCQLRTMEAGDFEPLGTALAAIDPWSRLEYGAGLLARYLGREDPALGRWVIERDGIPAGLLALRSPWLRGPYVELFAVLPGHQGMGIGSTVMDWVARQAAEIGHSLWACVSEFNDAARAFYARHGFEEIVPLDGLVQTGSAEILLRKRL